MNNKVEISFLGDISLNGRYVTERGLVSSAFTDILPYLEESDLVVGNLECLSESASGGNSLKKPRISTTRETLKVLGELNIGIVSLANNHVYDNLEDGFVNTCKTLDELDIEYLGASIDKNIFSKPLVKSINGMRFGFLNYVTSDTNPNIPKDAGVYVNEYEVQAIVKDITNIKKEVDVVILLLHWGGDVEGFDYPKRQQRTDAKKFIEAGADAIIGHHSHTWQPVEVLDGKIICYSLGNYCFDNIWCDGKLYYMSSFSSNIVKLTFSKNKVDVKYVPFTSKNLHLKIRNGMASGLGRQCQFFWMKIIHRYDFLFKATRTIWMPLKRLLKNQDLTVSQKIHRCFNKIRI